MLACARLQTFKLPHYIEEAVIYTRVECAFTGKGWVRMQTAARPSWIPVIVGAAACLLSLIIYFLPSLQASALIYFAYLLTPFTPILMMAITQTKNTTASSNIYYDLATGVKVLKLSRMFSIIGFLIAIPVIVVIATNFSEI